LTDRHYLDLAKDAPVGRWRAFFGLLLFILVAIVAQVGAIVAFAFLTGVAIGTEPLVSAQQEALFGVFLLVIGFGAPLLALLTWCKKLEKRDIKTLFTARATFNWPLALTGFAVAGALSMGLSFGLDAEATARVGARLMQFALADWLLLVAVYGVGIVIQAGFEELVVRGWVMQTLTRFGLGPLWCIGVSTIFFVALHLAHPGWATLAIAAALGLVLGWSVWRLNGLEAALGIHIANNFFAALLTGAMIEGNAPDMSANDLLIYCFYLLGLIVFVEAWARTLDGPARR
jgi:membrane protease YdiL (CAAX protease family)